jgi:hypothetical protein
VWDALTNQKVKHKACLCLPSGFDSVLGWPLDSHLRLEALRASQEALLLLQALLAAWLLEVFRPKHVP